MYLDAKVHDRLYGNFDNCAKRNKHIDKNQQPSILTIMTK